MNSSKDSQSFIQQSIYQSRTHHLDIPSSQFKQTTHKYPSNNPQSQKQINNFLQDQRSKPFLHFYEENIELKRKQDQMKRQILHLKSKVSQGNRNKRELQENELKRLATGKKSAWDNNKSKTGGRGTSFRGKGSVADSHNGRKVQQLLEIVDHYKSKLVTSQEEIQNLKRQKHLLEQDNKIKDKKADQIVKSYQQSSSMPGKDQKQLQEKLKSTIKQLQLQKQRNKYNQAEIKRLQMRIKNLAISGEEIDDLKQQNRNLEEKMLRLTQLPSFSNITNVVDEQRKYKELQNKYKTINEKYNSARNEKIKLQAEIKLLQNKLIECSQQADILQKENKKLREESIDNPILSKLAKNSKILAQVYYEFQERMKSGAKQSEKGSKIDFEKILLEKEMLAEEITSLKLKLEAMQEAFKEKERMNQIQREELANVYKDRAIGISKTDDRLNKVLSINGVSYSDDVGMFSQENIASIPVGYNYFDLFLGDLHLLDTMLRTIFNIHSAENCLVLATVDFYNHDTENTKPIHGSHCNLQSEFSFKVLEDQFFIKYLKKGSFYVDIWGLEGNKRHHYGRITIQLKPLVLKSIKTVAPVITSSVPIYLNQKVMGSINLSMRLRLPIHEQLQKVNLVGDMIDSEEKAVNRRLIIHIEEGRGFTQNSNTFVYYPFRLEDHYTKTFRGANPAWNHHKSLQLKYNNDLKNYLKKNELELVVIDDNAMINQQGSDVIGTAYISLLPLLQNRLIKERAQVMKGAHRVGTIDIKIFWHDTEKPKQEKSSIVHEITFEEKMINYLKDRRLQPQDVFNSIDRNQSGMISYDEFFLWVTNANLGATTQSINKFYNKFRQPVNLINWTSKLNELKAHPTKDIAQQLSRINQEMFKHTFEIHKKQSLEEYLRGKDLVDMALEIDKSGDGRISKKQLLQYFEQHDIDADVEEDEIEIVKFLKKYQNLM